MNEAAAGLLPEWFAELCGELVETETGWRWEDPTWGPTSAERAAADQAEAAALAALRSARSPEVGGDRGDPRTTGGQCQLHPERVEAASLVGDGRRDLERLAGCGTLGADGAHGHRSEWLPRSEGET